RPTRSPGRGTGTTSAGPARSRWAPTPTSTGRRSAASTRRTVTATWSARARLPRRSVSDPRSLIAHLQRSGRLPSLVLGVLRAGELAWSGGAGDVPGPVLATRYRIGSITKTLVAVAVLRLRDEGLVDLDDPLGRHLPDAGYGAVTLRQLLAHTGGLQSEPVGPWWERSPGVDRARLLVANDGAGAVADPGEWFHYSNLGYAFLGAVLRSEEHTSELQSRENLVC